MSFLKKVEVKAENKTTTQYAVLEKGFVPVGNTIQKLPAGIYSAHPSMDGVLFRTAEVKSDKLLRFEDPTHQTVLNEIKKFWELKDKYDRLGYLHNRAILLHGDPGSGKTCIVKLVIEDVVNAGNIVLMNDYVGDLLKGLRAFRDIEPSRQCLAVLDDVDALINRCGEHSLLELLDGENTVDNIMYLGTTNYISRIPARILRPGRFDRKIQVNFPPPSGRYAYIKDKMGGIYPEADIIKIVNATDGLSFGHLREFLIGVYCLDQDPIEVLKRLRNQGAEVISSVHTDKDLENLLFEKNKKFLHV